MSSGEYEQYVDVLIAKYPILKYMSSFEHLMKEQKEIAESFSKLAFHMAFVLPQGEETATCLRKLVEAKDCAVRSSIG